MRSRIYLEISLSELKAVLAVGTFHGSVALSSNVPSVARVLFRQAEDGINGL